MEPGALKQRHKESNVDGNAPQVTAHPRAGAPKWSGAQQPGANSVLGGVRGQQCHRLLVVYWTKGVKLSTILHRHPLNFTIRKESITHWFNEKKKKTVLCTLTCLITYLLYP